MTAGQQSPTGSRLGMQAQPSPVSEAADLVDRRRVALGAGASRWPGPAPRCLGRGGLGPGPGGCLGRCLGRCLGCLDRLRGLPRPRRPWSGTGRVPWQVPWPVPRLRLDRLRGSASAATALVRDRDGCLGRCLGRRPRLPRTGTAGRLGGDGGPGRTTRREAVGEPLAPAPMPGLTGCGRVRTGCLRASSARSISWTSAGTSLHGSADAASVAGRLEPLARLGAHGARLPGGAGPRPRWPPWPPRLRSGWRSGRLPPDVLPP